MELSQEQAQATYTKSNKALVIAGAGSGKTRVLTSRISWLINECQVSPYEISCFTFTRKAANEMKERLEKLIDTKVYNITMGTMHGVFLRFIQRFGEMVGLTPNKITIYSSWEEQFLLKDIALEMGYHTGKAWKGIKKKDVDEAFHVFYTTGYRSNNQTANEMLDVFLARCRENNALTYGTILTTFLELISKIKNYLNFKHILTDEVQDTDPLQWRIINLLVELTGASLYAVGDADQSIYSFRGADPEYLIRHKDEFDIYKLEDNYRSVPAIVESANKLIEHNENRLDNKMDAKRENSGISVFTGNGYSSERIKNLVADFIANQENDKKIAVLARNHYLLEKLSRLLKEAAIDHEYYGKKTELVRSEEFRRFHAFLKLIVNPYDNFSFLLIKDYIKISSADFKAIRLKAVHDCKSHFQACIKLFSNENELIQRLENFKNENIFEAVELLKDDIEFGFDTEGIIDFVYSWIIENLANANISNYLNWIATFDVQDEIKQEIDNRIELMTVHGSKGLEWPIVVIAGLNEGIFPSKHAQHNDKELESERRLAYVAWTRAKDQLFLTNRPTTDEDGNIKNPVSRFITEGGII